MAKKRLFINISRVAGVLILLIGTLSMAEPTKAANRTDIVGPAGSFWFGQSVTVLANGNFVVTDPEYTPAGGPTKAGAVHLYNGKTLALISTQTGSEPYAGLGYNGVVALTNGNYLILVPYWDNGPTSGVGAVTLCSGTSGCNGPISPSNSLIGSKVGDLTNVAVVALLNGSYAVQSPSWDYGSIVDAGAVTWCNGLSGCTGSISETNSLVGSQTDDRVGTVSVLANGNFIVTASYWDDGALPNAGAVTWCSGTSGCQGAVSPTNSAVGGVVDYLQATPLTNGNYVVSSTDWTTSTLIHAGAARWCSGNGGCTGPLTPSNSLVGAHAYDNVGSVRALANGTYVVRGYGWHNSSNVPVGAVTWCSGTGGCIGPVTEANSLVGSHTDDFFPVGQIYSLTDGDYIVMNPVWDNGTIVDAGAVTWCSGMGGCIGTISPANSLVGSHPDDMVGFTDYSSIQYTNILDNGNYVVSSGLWDNGAIVDAGAVTWCSGAGGCTGEVTEANSLIGSYTVHPLENGNYLTGATIEGTDVTVLCDGSEGCLGSLEDENYWLGSGWVVPLANGNFVVTASLWDNGVIVDAGAVTWCSGVSNCSEAVSAENSLVGSHTNDHVGQIDSVYPLSDGGYVVVSQDWDNGAIANSGAVTWIGGAAGTTVGPITEENSVLGEAANSGQMYGFGMNFVHDPIHFRLIISRPADNKITVLSIPTSETFLPLIKR